MRYLTIVILLLITVPTQAQSNPEVYLGDFELTEDGFSVTNLENISNNPGYDNQPSFVPNMPALLFSSQRGESTDIQLFDYEQNNSIWFTSSEGGKYSPTVMPDSDYFSSVWLKPNGEQLLWKFPLAEGQPEVIVPDEVIGYHSWFDEHTLYTFVLGDTFTFVEFDLEENSRTVIATNPGRSIHKVPERNEVSFIDKNDPTQWIVKTFNPETRKIRTLTATPEGSEDMFWIDASSFLIGQGNGLMMWKEGHGFIAPKPIFEKAGLISRIALSQDRTKIAIVFAEE
ncbi:MAG: hypothetical protein JJ971_14520 [Balneolaceae bacterium]|nr:hypothetical protein [Balneolaceae bacterium]MBO6547611.1 hypothetical protein [Balneolaceae bacterium]MBO6648122.1 hypothetical protein [Balneolaceae bacterium]